MFAKYPEKGRVKTRLSRFWGEDRVVRLYRAFIEDLLERLSKGDYRFRVAYDPINRKDHFIEMFGQTFSYLPQTGADLGDKMRHAFSRCFSDGFQSVVLIGSDSPDLPPQIIREAFQALERNGAVIGPSHDGGYYLIGFSLESFSQQVFSGIAWGTDSVFGKTMQFFKTAEILVHIMPTWRDVDRPEDVYSLIHDNLGTDFARSKTMSCLRLQGLGINDGGQ